MCLAKALFKDLFGCAVKLQRVKELNAACKSPVGLENKLVLSDKAKGWDKVWTLVLALCSICQEAH